MDNIFQIFNPENNPVFQSLYGERLVEEAEYEIIEPGNDLQSLQEPQSDEKHI